MLLLKGYGTELDPGERNYRLPATEKINEK